MDTASRDMQPQGSGSKTNHQLERKQQGRTAICAPEKINRSDQWTQQRKFITTKITAGTMVMIQATHTHQIHDQGQCLGQ